MERCFHCGQPCKTEIQHFDDKSFCCLGCKTVYEILHANDLCEYYSLNERPGIKQKDFDPSEFAWLDEPAIRKKILEFDSLGFSRVQFFVPSVHCISCIWLLENLPRISKGVLRAELNFPRKTIAIDFDSEVLSLGHLAGLLSSLGYAPRINLENEAEIKIPSDHDLIIKLAIAGFCFGNVMLLSFPEYLGIDSADRQLLTVFSWLNIILSVPVLLYSGVDYLKSAWSSFQYKHISIDVPIAAGLITLFARSLVDIATGTGPGYLDSFTGLVFFLLIGRWFQSKTYQSLAFDRDYKSYFPLAVHKLDKGTWKPVIIYDLAKGDMIRIRNMEIIPADSVLYDREALIDYSFVTGEARPVRVTEGETIFAGGRLIGQPVCLTVQKKTSQSHLTKLWNHDVFQKQSETRQQQLLDLAARWFTWAVLLLAIGTGVYWFVYNASQMWLVLTAVLMVACPCALALTAPFTYGNMLRVFGSNGLYLKNAEVIERMSQINAVVFDKTGTITQDKLRSVQFVGDLTKEESEYVKVLTGFSTHPLSKSIHKILNGRRDLPVTEFSEIPGEGIKGVIDNHLILIGSSEFVVERTDLGATSSQVYVSVNGIVRGHFQFRPAVRHGVGEALDRLKTYAVALLSGDNNSEAVKMRSLFGERAELKFNQSPHDKLDYIDKLKADGKRVMMLGDGLNDSGALKHSDVGIAVTDDTGIFTPACDGILQGDNIQLLPQFLQLAKSATRIVRAGFVISFIYNATALAVAASGLLTPLIAAILMPLSSISVVAFSTLAVKKVSRRLKHSATEDIEPQLHAEASATAEPLLIINY